MRAAGESGAITPVAQVADAPARGRRGTVIVTVAVLWQGLGTSVVGAVTAPELATFTTFVAFLAAAVIAAAAAHRARRAQRSPSSIVTPGLSAREVVVLNVVTAGAFSAFYIAAALVPPTVASVVETGVGPFAVGFMLLLARRPAPGMRQASLVLAIAAAVAWTGMRSFGNDTGHDVLGLSLSVLAGGCAAAVLLTSSSLARRGTTALQISVVRFHLAWILTGALGVPAALQLSPDRTGEIGTALLVGVTCIALPILLLQWGITLAPPATSALILTTLPAVVLVGDIALTGVVHLGLAVGMSVLVAVSLFGVVRAH